MVSKWFGRLMLALLIGLPGRSTEELGEWTPARGDGQRSSRQQDSADQSKLPSDRLPPSDVLVHQPPPLGLTTEPSWASPPETRVARVELGRRLFFDPLLSSDGTVACASCHRPDHGFASPDEVGVGIGGRLGRRNAPSLLNRGNGQFFSWDGRFQRLEDQSLRPLSDPNEMGHDLEAALQRVEESPTYQPMWKAAFGDQAVTAERLGEVLADFQRTLVIGNSPIDRFRAAEVGALSREARQGLWIFESRGGCWKCHNGENFTDESFHNTGVGHGLATRDLGRFEVTRQEEDRFRYKTPGLRGVALTAPYMHDGSLKTLEEVVEFYSRGGNPDDPERSALLEPFDLTPEEKSFLVAFLQALSVE